MVLLKLKTSLQCPQHENQGNVMGILVMDTYIFLITFKIQT